MNIPNDVQNAFATLGLTADADLNTATKAYKRLALVHHPDRNKGDPDATRRFQEVYSHYLHPNFFFVLHQQIGHAWDLCQKYIENPSLDDEELDLDEDDLFEYYMSVLHTQLRLSHL